ncbi:MAG TPA: YraN family protein [Burkholderiales bacterium]|nr:YraN family protein [Burkholderiales bacterium]
MSLRGARAEEIAADFLAQRGLKLVERNYRCRFGEIDLIMSDGRALVFVEVRYRRNKSFGGAVESITGSKRTRLLRAARHYMASLGQFPACRFDAVLLDGDTQNLEWVENAFGE